MYKKQSDTQRSLEDFNQPMGLTMNPENRWVQKAALIPWSALEDQYAALFKSDKDNVAKPFRMAFGALLIQQTYDYSDEETVQQVQENPYLQFFVGLSGYKDQPRFEAATMVHFRKRLTEERLMAINDTILGHHETENDDAPDDDADTGSTAGRHDAGDDASNQGILMLDATCAPFHIKYPQDISLLDDARRHAENIIDALCEANGLKNREPTAVAPVRPTSPSPNGERNQSQSFAKRSVNSWAMWPGTCVTFMRFWIKGRS